MRVARWVPAVVLAVLVAGCGGSGSSGGSPDRSAPDPSSSEASSPGPSASDPSSSDPSAEPAAEPSDQGVDAAPPPAEGTGAERPQKRKDDGPYLTSAGLPIGGDPVEDVDGTPRCARATWLGEDIPAGVMVRVRATVVDPAAFSVGGDGCAGAEDPPCAGFAFGSDARRCVVPLTRTGEHLDEVAALSLSGQAECPQDRRGFCDLLVTAPGQNMQVVAYPIAPGPAATSGPDGWR